MKNKKWWLILIAILIVMGVGGKIHMDRRAKELEALHIIQKDLANYIYQNFVVTINDEKKDAEIDKQYEENKDKWTIIEYLDKLKTAQVRHNVDKIEFVNITISPSRSLEIQFKVNDVYDDYTLLNTKLAGTEEWVYDIGEYNGSGPYYLEKKKQITNEPMPDNKIIYYEGGIN